MIVVCLYKIWNKFFPLVKTRDRKLKTSISLQKKIFIDENLKRKSFFLQQGHGKEKVCLNFFFCIPKTSLIM